MTHASVAFRALLAVACCAPIATAGAQQSAAERITFHGYITQAFGESDKEGVLGIPTGGTTEYRKVALQLRYAATEKSAVVLQFGHRRLGADPTAEQTSDVTLDWAFFQQSIGGGNLKVGRVPMPKGIYNEIRFVGTLLPFFRAPFATYTEGFETLDGASFNRVIGEGKLFSLDASAYYGGLDYLSASHQPPPTGAVVTEMHMDRVRGGQLWLNTPLEGVRVGGAATWSRVSDGEASETHSQSKSFTYSADATFDRAFARAELTSFEMPGVEYSGWYAHGAVRATQKLSFTGEISDAAVDVATPVGSMTMEMIRDVAGGVNFAFDPRVVLKAEYHLFEGTGVDRFVNPMGALPKTNYLLVSLSASF